MAFKAFIDYPLRSSYVSRTGLEIIRKLIKGENITREEIGIKKM